jgi:hypothetical protein
VAVTRLEDIPRAVARAWLRLVLLVLGVGSLRWIEGLTVGLAIQAALAAVAPPRRPAAPRPLDRPGRDGAGTSGWRRARAPADPIEAALV